MKKSLLVLAALLLLFLMVGIVYADEICGTCRGAGFNVCLRCGGSGEYENRRGDTVECGSCAGSGKVTCFPCGGTGRR